ncbi:MAG: DUF309 domain-containing protein [Synechococcus sp. SupBloom_Metag_053]|nr:DUF309 domain-containing protein [Synechococcus sp. SupBloom_Metag_053]
MEAFKDHRFCSGIENFNDGQYYLAHDLFEDLWHDTQEPERRWIHGIVQISVAMYHKLNGNINGAILLLAEGIARITSSLSTPAGLNDELLLKVCRRQLELLQDFQQKHKKFLPPNEYSAFISLFPQPLLVFAS